MSCIQPSPKALCGPTWGFSEVAGSNKDDGGVKGVTAWLWEAPPKRG